MSYIARALTGMISPRTTLLVWERLFWLMGRRRLPSGSEPVVKNILVVRNDGIGDVVMTTPLLRGLRNRYPDAWITLVVRPAVHNLVESCPYIDEAIVFDRNPTDRSELRNVRRYFRAVKLAARSLWKRRFDIAIVPRWEADHYFSSYISYLSGAPRRIGYSESVSGYKLALNEDYNCLFTDVLKDAALKHELEHDLDILKHLGGEEQDKRPEVWFSNDDMRRARGLLVARGWNPAQPLIAFGIGATSPARRWSPKRYAAIASWLIEEVQAQILLIGSTADKPLAEDFTESCSHNVIDATGQTTLREAAAMLSQCSFYAGNNTGTMHMAAALGLPVAEISTNATTCSPLHHHSSQRFGPWNVAHCLIQPERSLDGCTEGCSKSAAHCILEITVDQARNALASFLPTRFTSRTPRDTTLVR